MNALVTPLQFESHTLANVDQMVAVALKRVEQGPTQTLYRDDWEPSLMWLDRLAAQRSDWQPWVTETWRRLLCSSSPAVAGGAVDALHFGEMGFASLRMLLSLAERFDTQSNAVTAPGTHAPYTLGDVVELLEKRQAHYGDDTIWLMLSTPSFEWAQLQSVDDAIDLARRAASVGSSLIGGYAGMNQPLDWLRKVVLLAPRCRPWVPAVIEAMICGEQPEMAAACEYLVRCPDTWMSLPGLHSALGSSSALGAYQPVLSSVAHANCSAESLSELAAWLELQAQSEQQTSPQRDTLLAFGARASPFI